MTKYEARINKSSLFTQVVRIDNDGQEQVCNDYKGRHFSTLNGAMKSTDKYLKKIGA